MLKKIFKYVKFLNTIQAPQNASVHRETYVEDSYDIYEDIEMNLQHLRNVFGKSDDILFRKFKIGNVNALICYVAGLVEKELISRNIVKPLVLKLSSASLNENASSGELFALARENILLSASLKEENAFKNVISEMLSGKTALFIQGCNQALLIDSQGYATRGIQEPPTEPVVRGPRDGFTENLHTNISLLRRRIKNPNLIFKILELGKQSRTRVSIVYIDRIANPKIVEEVIRRVNRIDTDAILESGYIEQFIQDHPLSVFPTIGNTEKPDKVAGKLLEGRVALICDGSPFVITVPYLFIETIQVSEDYYTRFFVASFLRLLRIFALWVTLLLAPLYIALETFHQEMLPAILLISMAASREDIPFPSFVETVILLTIFELLRESGIRLPRPIGQTISMVGTLVIGQAAVEAGIISAPLVIIGAITAIAGFIVPPLLEVLVFWRFFLIVLAASFGLLGIIVGLFVMIAHLCSLRSFGIPYMDPIAPVIWKDLKDSFIRSPLWLMKSRPKWIAKENVKRQGQGLMPNPPEGDTEGRGEDY